MTQNRALQVNPSEETIRLGPLAVHFLLTGENSTGSIAAFEVLVPLCVITPAAIGPEFFRECAEAINAAAGGPPDRAKMVEIMRRHGLTPAPSPAQA